MIRTMQTPGLVDLILANTEVTADGCRVWLGATHKGYGRVTVNARPARVHRVVYELTIGPIPGDLTVDHLCRNRGCVNTDHLELVTAAENKARKPLPETCSNGHAYTPQNTKQRAGGGRRCQTCQREYDRRYDDKRRTRPAEPRGVGSAPNTHR